MSTPWSQAKPAIAMLSWMTLLTGLVYPLAVTGVAQLIFPEQAEGSLVTRNGKVVGSHFVGQNFSGPSYFWSRPSATSPAYNGGASSGSNLGPTNAALAERLTATANHLRENHPGAGLIPVDLATASGSGLDPHVSPAAALLQVDRVAAARALSVATVRDLVTKRIEGRQLGFLGEPRVNVLLLNLALDELQPPAPRSPPSPS